MSIFVPSYMETQEVSGYWMLIIADTLLLAGTFMRDKNNHLENYYAEGKKSLFTLRKINSF